MRKRLISLFLLFLLPCSCVYAWQEEIFHTSGGLRLAFRCRAFEPGEILLVSLENDPGIKSARLVFLDHNYLFQNLGIPNQLLCLVGLDYLLKPGLYPFQAIIEKHNRRREILEIEMYLFPRKFPTKKLRVKEEYVIPPPQVEERIRREEELLRVIYDILTPRWLAEGSFILPFRGRITAGFGEKRIYNNIPRSTHTGIDIAAPLGAPIFASNSGRVAVASDLYFSGKTVIIDHGWGLFTFYGHLSRILVRRGESVKKGTIIGLVGSTGRSTGPHLHWGVRIFDGRVDPLSLISFSFDKN